MLEPDWQRLVNVEIQSGSPKKIAVGLEKNRASCVNKIRTVGVCLLSLHRRQTQMRTSLFSLSSYCLSLLSDNGAAAQVKES
jgi:hypothetical protein